MSEDWLRKMVRVVSVADAEAANMVQIDRLGPDPVPFGFSNDRWRALIAKMQVGDELWEFCSPKEDWMHFCASKGYALVRNDEVVAFTVSLRN